MKATLVTREKIRYPDGAIREMKIWRLPRADVERPHGFKYGLYYGRAGVRLVCYDNERGKGDHRHYSEREEPYAFESIEKTTSDFRPDVARERGE